MLLSSPPPPGGPGSSPGSAARELLLCPPPPQEAMSLLLAPPLFAALALTRTKRFIAHKAQNFGQKRTDDRYRRCSHGHPSYVVSDKI